MVEDGLLQLLMVYHRWSSLDHRLQRGHELSHSPLDLPWCQAQNLQASTRGSTSRLSADDVQQALTKHHLYAGPPSVHDRPKWHRLFVLLVLEEFPAQLRRRPAWRCHKPVSKVWCALSSLL